MLNYCYSYFLD